MNASGGTREFRRGCYHPISELNFESMKQGVAGASGSLVGTREQKEIRQKEQRKSLHCYQNTLYYR